MLLCYYCYVSIDVSVTNGMIPVGMMAFTLTVASSLICFSFNSVSLGNTLKCQELRDTSTSSTLYSEGYTE